jgi:hypothetical protein
VSPTEVTDKTDLLPTTIDEGIAGLGGQKREMLPGSDVDVLRVMMARR